VARILMFSGGLDSFIVKRLYHFANEECLFIRMNTRENQIEEAYLDARFPGVKKSDLFLNQFELENKIIPFRNHFLTLVAAQFANEIWFGFTAGDTTKDKDYIFKAQMEGLLNYFSLSTDKVLIQGPFTVALPIKNKTKTQVVKDFLYSPETTAQELIDTTSCYAGLEKPCGQCRSCLRKFVSLTLNDIECCDSFLHNPVDGNLVEFYEECKRKNRHQEIEEVEECLKRFGVIISS